MTAACQRRSNAKRVAFIIMLSDAKCGVFTDSISYEKTWMVKNINHWRVWVGFKTQCDVQLTGLFRNSLGFIILILFRFCLGLVKIQWLEHSTDSCCSSLSKRIQRLPLIVLMKFPFIFLSNIFSLCHLILVHWSLVFLFWHVSLIFMNVNAYFIF